MVKCFRRTAKDGHRYTACMRKGKAKAKPKRQKVNRRAPGVDASNIVTGKRARRRIIL